MIFFIKSFFLYSCSSFIKPNIYLLDKKFEQLQRDSFFIVSLNQNQVILFEDTDIFNYENKFKNLNFDTHSNLYSIYALKTGNIELAEKTWWSLIEKKDPISFLNLLRTFYILEDQEGIEELFNKFYNKKHFSFEQAQENIEILILQKRFEELMLCLDYLSSNTELQITERLQIANYYLIYVGTNRAKDEFEKILSTYSFNKEALEGMIKVYFFEENYETSNMFLKTYLKFYKPNEEIILLGMEIYYRLSLYQEGLTLAKQISNPKNKIKFYSLLKALHYSFSYKTNKTLLAPEELQVFISLLSGE